MPQRTSYLDYSHTIMVDVDGTPTPWIVCDTVVDLVDVIAEAQYVQDHDGWKVIAIRNDVDGTWLDWPVSIDS